MAGVPAMAPGPTVTRAIMTMTFQRRILIVDDNSGDVRLLQEALRKCGRSVETTVAPDGVEALRQLQQRAIESNLPELVILDLGLPKLSGLDVLARIKEDPALKAIPVIVFSTSAAPADVAVAYQLHANCYIRKPASLEELFQVVAQIERYWYGTAILPNNASDLPSAIKLPQKTAP